MKPVINLDSINNNCTRCGGTGWLQRATLFRGRIKAKRCPELIHKKRGFNSKAVKDVNS